jgi:hypothetical protein
MTFQEDGNLLRLVFGHSVSDQSAAEARLSQDLQEMAVID